jgi:hypothetical protein
MTTTKRVAALVGGAMGLATLAGAGLMARNWYRYGAHAEDGDTDPLLDRVMPVYDVREYHEIEVEAPAAETYAAARELDIRRSGLVRAIFRGRELLLHATGERAAVARPLVLECLALGWGLLAEEPGRELVMGAVTRPWEPDVRFWSLPPREFAAFDAPGYAKIAWTLAAQEAGPGKSIAHTETRVLTTDPSARSRFRRYWALVSPGVVVIRRQSLRIVKADAERRFRGEAPGLETRAGLAN